jgi:hypothetical protein
MPKKLPRSLVAGLDARPEGRYVPGPRTPPNVDLAAWARGEKEYIFGEVKRAINWYLHSLNAPFVDFEERREAVEFLIAEGFIEPAEARKDVFHKDGWLDELVAKLRGESRESDPEWLKAAKKRWRALYREPKKPKRRRRTSSPARRRADKQAP